MLRHGAAAPITSPDTTSGERAPTKDRRLSPPGPLRAPRLAGLEPAWQLSGGAALVGFHCGQRTTRDLDLVWRAAELALAKPG